MLTQDNRKMSYASHEGPKSEHMVRSLRLAGASRNSLCDPSSDLGVWLFQEKIGKRRELPFSTCFVLHVNHLKFTTPLHQTMKAVSLA